MKKRLSSKLLSIVLTIAICATTVFGCLMTVSANNSCYSFGAPKFPSADDLSEVSIDVTFTAPASLPNGFYSGGFTVAEVNADAEDYLILKDVTGVTAGISVDVYDNYVLFSTEASDNVTFSIVFGFSKGTATKAREYSVQLSDVELYHSDKEYYVETAAGAIGTISAECSHEVKVVGDPIAVDKANNYSTYANSICTLCGEEFGVQLVPTTEKLSDNDEQQADELNVVYVQYGTAPNGEPDGSFLDGTHGTGEKDNPYVISTPGQLRYLAQKSTYATTHGKFFEIDENIDVLCLQSQSYIGDINALMNMSAEEVKTLLSNTTNRTIWQSGASNANDCFSGTLDGNGVKIVGIYTENGGLFNSVNEGAVIKNLTVSNSYITAGWYAGSIVGSLYCSNVYIEETLTKENGYSMNANPYGKVSFENVVAANNYIYNTGNAQSSTGILLGSVTSTARDFKNNANSSILEPDGEKEYYNHVAVSMENVIVYGNKAFAETTKGSGTFAEHPYLFGTLSASYNGDGAGFPNGSYKNSIILDCVPYAYAQSNQAFKPNYYTNVYTNRSTTSHWPSANGTSWNKYDITFNVANVTGADAMKAMMKLDWGKTWIAGAEGEYPHVAPEGYVNDTIGWSGDVATGIAEGSGEKGDPYIINTVAELAWLVQQKNTNTDGKYYKVADGIKNIVLQPYAYSAEIMALNSAAKTKAYFENGSFIPWKTTGWDAASFAGYFDGNGATIYGLYATSSNNAALFCEVEGGSALVNVGIKNSYITSSANNYQVGALIGLTSSLSYGAKRDSIVWVKDVVIANNYLYNGCLSSETGRSGIVAGCINEAIQIENALVYGNDATYGRDDAIYKMPLCGNIYNNVTPAEKHHDGLVVKTGVVVDEHDVEQTYYYNQVKNSIILGADVANVRGPVSSRRNDGDCFENVYADILSAEVAYSDGKQTYTEEQIKPIVFADATGATAPNNLPNLAWGSEWYCGAEGELPVLAKFAVLGAKPTSTPSHKLFGSSVTYNNDGTLDFNLHFVPGYEGVKATLFVGTLDGSKFFKLTSTESSYRDDLGEGALMFTLPNISARDIDKVWLPTVVVEGGEKTEWGPSVAIALADNSKAILAGDYDAADKQVAAALLNYGIAADDALNAQTTSVEKTKTEFWNNWTSVEAENSIEDLADADDGSGDGSSWEKAIIIDNADELYWLCRISTWDVTQGKYFKVADDIKNFILAPKAQVDAEKLMAMTDPAEVETYLNSINSGKGWNWHGEGSFCGNFDGNGVTIYGLRGSGVFGKVDGGTKNTNDYYVQNGNTFYYDYTGIVIKNINVRNSLYNGWEYGGIVCKTASYTEGATVTGKVNIQSCSVANCFFTNDVGHGVSSVLKNHNRGSKGVLVGNFQNRDQYAVDNCIAYGNKGYFYTSDANGNITSTYTTLFAAGRSSDAFYPTSDTDHAFNTGKRAFSTITNSILIGVNPYLNDFSYQSGANTSFENIYTTEAVGTITFDNKNSSGDYYTYTYSENDMKQLSDEAFKGTSAKENLDLDFDDKWLLTEGYPQLIQSAYVSTSAGETIYWTTGTYTSENSIDKVNDTKAAGTSWDTAIIIDNVEELNYIIRQAGVTNTYGKYFKIADGIGRIVLQKEGVLDLDKLLACKDGNAVESYFNTLDTTKLVSWSGGGVFDGNLDGNGVEIIGAYESSANAGFISCFDGGALNSSSASADVIYDNEGIVVKNLTVRNSYFVSSNRIAVLGSQSFSPGWGANVHGILNLENCAVINNYLKNTVRAYSSNYCGVVTGDVNDMVRMNNMLVYGNDATDVNGDALWLRGMGLRNDRKDSNGEFIHNTVTNSIVIGADPFGGTSSQNRRNTAESYENLFTDTAIPTYDAFKDTDVQRISAADLAGSKAQTLLDTLNAAGGKFYVGALDDMPGLVPSGNVPSVYQSKIDDVQFTTFDTVGDDVEYYSSGSMKFGVYQTGISLKANPYMSFAFAFGGEYKENREKIKVRFTYTIDGETDSVEVSVPEYTGADIKSVNGWTNTAASGRFHTYKAECIPVKALANAIKVEASYNGGEWKDLGTYSVEGLGMQFDALNKTQPCEYHATRVDATKALLFYAKAVSARYGA